MARNNRPILRIAVLTFCAEIGLAQPVWPDGPFREMTTPALPYVDHGACPGEGCQYAKWTAHRTVTVYDTHDAGGKVIAELHAGDQATGIMGMVITYRPGMIRMDRDLPERNLRRGDMILTYTDRGEGFSEVWFQGRYYPEYDVSFAKLLNGQGCGGDHCAASYVDSGKHSWWAEVKFAGNRTGWLDMELDQTPVALY